MRPMPHIEIAIAFAAVGVKRQFTGVLGNHDTEYNPFSGGRADPTKRQPFLQQFWQLRDSVCLRTKHDGGQNEDAAEKKRYNKLHALNGAGR
ncbi:MAG: hypothetical protein JWL90_884 [Chthoniobacteraceae bacterium]|nr:hypothetical protein [Chthoniobacteraceae bacterium]